MNRLFGFFISIFCLGTQFVFANNWYIDTKGSDTNSGLSNDPFLSIQKGINNVLAGDTIFVKEGVYVIDKQLLIDKSGNLNRWICLVGIGKVEIDGSKVIKRSDAKSFSFGTNGVLHIEKSSYISIQNITVKNSHSAGIIVKGPSKCIKLENCKAENTFNSGIAVWYSDSVKILSCEVSGATRQEMRVDYPLHSEAPHEAISLCGARYFEVAYNEVHHCDKEGVDCKEVSAFGIIHHNYVHDMPRQGLYVDSWFGTLHDIEFYSNTVFNCEWGMAISGEGETSYMENISIHHNLFYKNKASGLLFGVWGNNCERKNILIYNNTIIENGSENHWAGLVGGIDIKSSSIKNVNIYNNIIANNYCFQIAIAEKPENVNGFLKEKNISIYDNLAFPYKLTPSVQKSYFNDVFSIKGTRTIEEPPLLDSLFIPPKGSSALNSEKNLSQSDIGAFEKYKPQFFPPKFNEK